jgi:two-component system OmpR family sensor kinase
VFRSLQARLTLSHVAIILICLVLVGLAALVLLRGYQRNQIYRSLEDRAVLISRLASNEIVLRRLSPQEAIRRLMREPGQDRELFASLYLLDLEGQVIAGSNNRLTGQRFEGLAVTAESAPQWPVRGLRQLESEERVLWVAQPVWRHSEAPRPEGVEGDTGSREMVYILLLTAPNRGAVVAATDLLPRLLWAGVVALVVSFVIAALMAYSIAHPLERIAQAAEEIAAGNYNQQLDISTPQEVARLAASFNRMASQVQATLQSQRDLVANVSHELKTPLTSIQGFSQALLDGTASDEQSRGQAAAIIHEEAGRMRRLVEELLELARLEAGQVTLAREPVDVVELLRTCVARFAPGSDQGGVVVEVQAPPSLPPVIGDLDRLEQVFGNLVGNAITAVMSSSVGMSDRQARVVLRAEQQDGLVVCSVTDNGPGIPAEHLSRIFERFYQVDGSRRREELSPTGRGGAGLGLAIAREIVQAHGGQIAVESVEGLGTRFIVRLPAHLK